MVTLLIISYYSLSRGMCLLTHHQMPPHRPHAMALPSNTQVRKDLVGTGFECDQSSSFGSDSEAYTLTSEQFMCKMAEAKQIFSEGEYFLRGCSQHADFTAVLSGAGDLHTAVVYP